MTDLTAATAALVAATGQLVGTKAELLDWSVGTVTGGPDGTGDYPFTAADGTIIKVPAPEKIAAMNGDPTSAAATLQAVADAAVAAAASSSGSATTATQQAGLATGAATTATTEAGIATTQAGTAASAASTATGAAATATGAAGTATTQAGIATGGATAATTQAGIATGAATTATTKATAAATSSMAAAGSATGAATSAASAGSSAAGLAASYKLISAASVPTWSLPIVDPYGFGIGGIDASGNASFPSVSTPSLTTTGNLTAPIITTPTLAGVSNIIGAGTGHSFFVADPYGFASFGVARDGGIRVSNGPGGEAFMVLDEYGLGGLVVDKAGNVTVGGLTAKTVNGAVPSGSATDYISPADYNRDYRGTWYSVVQGMLYRGGSGAIAIVSGSQFEVDFGGCGLPFAQRVTKAFGDGGPGWVPIFKNNGFNVGSCTSANQQAKWTVSGSWTGSYLTVADSPDICSGATSTAGNTATLAFTGTGAITTAELHHLGGGGTFSYAYSGGVATQVTLPSAPDKLVLAAPPAGAWTCVFTAVSGSLSIAGAVLKKATGCAVHNLANGGSAAYHYAGVDQTKRRAALARLGFDAVFTSLGANDEGAARTVAQFVADMQTNIAAPRAVNTACAVVVGMQPQTNRVPATGWSPAIAPMLAAYTEGMRPLAKPGLFGLYCSQPRFGTVPSQYDYGGTAFIGTGPDFHHFNQTGRDIYVSGGCEMLGA